MALFLPSEALLYALGWTVLHALWQSAIIGIGLAAILRFSEKKPSEWRYALSNMALLSVLGWSVFTFFDLYAGYTPMSGESLSGGFSGEISEPSFVQHTCARFKFFFNAHLSAIVGVWLAGMVVFMIRMAGGWLYIQRLKRKHHRPVSSFWRQKTAALCRQIQLSRPVRLVESAMVGVPMVIGYFKPVILMPVGALNQLSVEEMEAVLAHELAHIYRNDYLFNILQSIIETLFYFNPAVWWISSVIRRERENCCDDLAVKWCGDSLLYAKALVGLQSIPSAAPLLAMPFFKNKGELLARVQRILHPSTYKSNIMEKITATFMLFIALIMLTFGATASGTPYPATTDDPAFSPPMVSLTGTLPAMDFIEPDSIPQKEVRTNVTSKRETVLKMKDGKITKLKIDGKTIPESEYEKYIDDLNVMPAPPAPPTPPTPPTPPVPPAPPAPPAQPDAHLQTKNKIITRTQENGHTRIRIEDENNSEPIIIQLGPDNDGVVILKGKAVGDLDENKPVIIHSGEGDSGENRLFFDFGPGSFEYQFEMPDLKALKEQEKELEKTLKKFEDENSFNDGETTAALHRALAEHQKIMVERNRQIQEHMRKLRERMHAQLELNEQERAALREQVRKEHQRVMEENRKIAEEHRRLLQEKMEALREAAGKSHERRAY